MPSRDERDFTAVNEALKQSSFDKRFSMPSRDGRDFQFVCPLPKCVAGLVRLFRLVGPLIVMMKIY